MRRVLLSVKLDNHFTSEEGILTDMASVGFVSQARGIEIAAQLTTTSGCIAS